MDSDELHVLKYNCLHGSKEAIEQAFHHIEELRGLVENLAEGLECEELQREVARIMEREEPEITQ